MNLFNQILGAIDNPNQEGSSNQLADMLGVVQQLSGAHQADPSALQSALSIVGNYTRSALSEQKNTGGEELAQQTIDQFAGNQANNGAVNALFGNSQIQNIAQEIENRTGINQSTVLSMLPTLVPLVLNFLKTGNSTQGSNSVLSGFLDSNGDGNVDIGDAMQMAAQYLNR